ncbi:hypothetical protein BDW68DRAFT_183463 [Aspergillus falconensis]
MQRCSTHVYWNYLLTICGCQPPSYTRARSPLNDPEWKTVPWTYIAKTPKDLLADIFMEIPSLLADLDELRTAEDAYMKGEALIRKCWHLEKQWREWQRKYEPQTDPVMNSSETVSPSQVFDGFLVAHIMGGYWAIGIFLYGVFHLAVGTPRDESGGYGVHGGIFPSLVALMYLEKADGDLNSSEACAIYTLFDRCNRGRKILHVVENMRQRLKAGGVRLFEPVYN